MYSLIGLIIVAGVNWGESHVFQQKMLLKQLDNRIAGLKEEVAKVNELQGNVANLELEIDQLVKIRQENVPILDIFKEVTDLIPDTASLHEFIIKGENIQFAGTAKSASDLVAILETSHLFKDVVFLTTITKDKNGNEKFRIGLTFE